MVAAECRGPILHLYRKNRKHSCELTMRELRVFIARSVSEGDKKIMKARGVSQGTPIVYHKETQKAQENSSREIAAKKAKMNKERLCGMNRLLRNSSSAPRKVSMFL